MTPTHAVLLRTLLRIFSAVLTVVVLGGLTEAKARARATGGAAVQAPAPQAPAPAGRGRGGQMSSPASQRPPDSQTPQAYAPEQIKAGEPLFAAQCGFCHGRDARGGQSGPDLTRSELVAADVRGDKIIPLVKTGRPDKGMPPFALGDADLTSIVAFIHDAKTKSASNEGDRRTVEVADLQTGNAEAGKTYFNGAGGCAKCHSPSGDFAGLATRLQGLQLMQRMLYPGARGRSGGPSGPKVTVTLPSGQTVAGQLTFRDEFSIGLIDDDGWRRTWSTSQVKFAVDDPLDAHAAQLAKYTDADMHNVLAYLQTLR
jgi:cytochrome c oxidase cbb3-type subunit 3